MRRLNVKCIGTACSSTETACLANLHVKDGLSTQVQLELQESPVYLQARCQAGLSEAGAGQETRLAQQSVLPGQL